MDHHHHHQRSSSSSSSTTTTPLLPSSSSKKFEQQHVLARLQRRGIPAPTSFNDHRSVALTLAAIQSIMEETKLKMDTKRAEQQQAATQTPTATTRTRQGVAELTLSLKAYEKEIEKLQARLRQERREVEALEALAPPPTRGGGEGGSSDPIRLLEDIRKKAQAVLAQRERIMTKAEEEEAALLRRGEGVAGPLSDAPKEEAKRLVARKWMGGRRRSSVAPHYTEELID